jgi:hypothetical protein
MSQDFRQFAYRLTIYALVISTLAVIAFLFLPVSSHTPALAFIIPFFFVVTLISHYLSLKATEKKPAGFINAYMAQNILKLFLYIAVMLAYVFLINRVDAVNFIVTYFIFYVVFTVFEIYHIQKRLTRKL